MAHLRRDGTAVAAVVLALFLDGFAVGGPADGTLERLRAKVLVPPAGTRCLAAAI